MSTARTVLVIDDDPDIREVLQVALEGRGGVEPGDAVLEFAGVDQVLALAVQALAGCARGQQEHRDHGKAFHFAFPRLSVCLSLSGRYMNTISSAPTAST